jgi:predicted  nucleic acid-binding Zn-ribbon protein
MWVKLLLALAKLAPWAIDVTRLNLEQADTRRDLDKMLVLARELRATQAAQLAEAKRVRASAEALSATIDDIDRRVERIKNDAR